MKINIYNSESKIIYNEENETRTFLVDDIDLLLGRQKFKGEIDFNNNNYNYKKYRSAVEKNLIRIYSFDRSYYLSKDFSLEEIIDDAFLILGLKTNDEVKNNIQNNLENFNIPFYSYFNELSSGQQQIFIVLLSTFIPSDISLIENIFVNVDKINIPKLIDIIQNRNNSNYIFYTNSHEKITGGQLDKQEVETIPQKLYKKTTYLQKFFLLILSFVTLLIPLLTCSIIENDKINEKKEIIKSQYIFTEEAHTNNGEIEEYVIEKENCAYFVKKELLIGKNKVPIYLDYRFGDASFSKEKTKEDTLIISNNVSKLFKDMEATKNFVKYVFGLNNVIIDNSISNSIVLPKNLSNVLKNIDSNGYIYIPYTNEEIFDRDNNKLEYQKDKIYLPDILKDSEVIDSTRIGGYYYSKYNAPIVLLGSEYSLIQKDYTYELIGITNDLSVKNDLLVQLKISDINKTITLLRAIAFVVPLLGLIVGTILITYPTLKENKARKKYHIYPFKLDVLEDIKYKIYPLGVLLLYLILIPTLQLNALLYLLIGLGTIIISFILTPLLIFIYSIK